MKIRPFYIIIVCLLAASILIFSWITYIKIVCSDEKSAYIMGTPVKVVVNGTNSARLVLEAIVEIKRLDSLFSKYNPTSEVSQINEFAGRKAIRVSDDTYECLELADEISKSTKGAFDVSLGSGFYLNPEKQTVFLKRKGAQIDLGGIGKGYAAEAARILLLKKGAKSGMIDMRSSIAVFGDKTWKIGIQHPREKGKLIGLIELQSGQSLGSSGDYERGKHIIDPRTGQAAKQCQSVTIVGKDAAIADALSTAVFVLGPGEGIKLIESVPDFECLIVNAKGNIIQSSGFKLIKK